MHVIGYSGIASTPDFRMECIRRLVCLVEKSQNALTNFSVDETCNLLLLQYYCVTIDKQRKTRVKVGSAMATITVRVDDETKLKASDIAEDFGFDLSSVTRAFYRQMVRERRIPLNLSYEPIPNEQTLAAIREAEEIAQTGRQRFKNADEMFDSLGI